MTSLGEFALKGTCHCIDLGLKDGVEVAYLPLDHPPTHTGRSLHPHKFRMPSQHFLYQLIGYPPCADLPPT